MTAELRAALGDRFADTVLARAPLCWRSGVWDFLKPGSYLGLDGGGGVGSGPGMAVGAALAARASGRFTVGMLGDGDTFMAPQAIWTAAHHEIPVLLVVANNESYFNDEAHQDRVARLRGRPPENRWVGQRIERPSVDLAGLARSMGAEGFGPVMDPAKLADVYREAIAAVDSGRPALVDVRVATR
jgi:thiamine pyrophosphate-dependent acetolactate synthase large subunit-like protein